MGKPTTLFAGLDGHKDSIDIGLCEPGRSSDLRHLGTVAGGCEAVTKAPRRQLTGASQTDRRGTLKLTRQARDGGLAVVRVPDSADEALRDVVRARELTGFVWAIAREVTLPAQQAQ